MDLDEVEESMATVIEKLHKMTVPEWEDDGTLLNRLQEQVNEYRRLGEIWEELAKGGK